MRSPHVGGFGPLNVTAASLCHDPSQIPAVDGLPSDEFRLVGGLCKFDKNMTEVTGRLQGVTGADDPRVRLIVVATQELTTPAPPTASCTTTTAAAAMRNDEIPGNGAVTPP